MRKSIQILTRYSVLLFVFFAILLGVLGVVRGWQSCTIILPLLFCLIALWGIGRMGLLMLHFLKEKQPNHLTDAQKAELIDIILPCYNPSQGWEQTMIEQHKELDNLMQDCKFRLIVVNDGSRRGFTKDAVDQLKAVLPDTIIVDNKRNQGKGGAVRDGLKYSDSDLALYTDYDFPYRTESICRVIECLKAGYDVVIARRNRTYYSQLSTRRMLASHASRLLNFMLLGLTYTDTQGGLKGFNCKGKAFLASTQIKQFLFDTEFIYKASLNNAVFIKEIPVNLRSKVMLPDMKRGVFINELKNLFMICWRG